MDTLRYKIYFKDRVGMVLDISHIVSSRNINIVSLQVLPNNTFLELEPLANKVREELEQEFRKIPGVINVVRIEVMPFEERERQLKTVLDSVSEGIIAIDKDGLITTFNPVCERILHYRASEVIGKHISTVLSPDIPMLQALQHGKTYDNYEITVKTPGGRANYLSSSRLIRDNHGKIMGVVAAIKDMPKVREMAYAIIKPAEITFEDIVGVSEGIERVKTLARLVASSDSTVLIRGESGTGKELFARAIYAASQRRGKPFIPVNCAALPDTLLESELFGYTEGAFTGAKKGGKQGLFEFADQGVIFLDEIGELSPYLQAKLLRVIQEGKVRRLGESEERSIDVRLITATNRNLEEMLKKQAFREDFYYRINVFPITIPPLRERKEDIPILVKYLIEKFNLRLGKHVEEIDREAMNLLSRYPWKGNVRELENVVERAMNLVTGKVITNEHIIIGNVEDDRIFFTFQENTSLAQMIDNYEREILQEFLSRYGSSRKLGKQLGVSHTTILNKLKKHGLLSGN